MIRQYNLKSVRKQILAAAYRSADKVITVSGNAKKSVAGYFKLPDDSIAVIENGVDVAKIQKLSDEKFSCPYGGYLISVGRLEPMHKNFSFLLDVAYQLKSKYHIDMPIVILGEGKDRVNLEQKAVTLGIRLYMPGFVENPYPFIKGAKVYAVTSTYESFHLGIIEAMVCGTPVISVNCPGGISEIITSGENGILVEQSDKDAFASAIAKVHNDIELTRILSANAKIMAENKYNIQLMVRKYEALLR